MAEKADLYDVIVVGAGPSGLTAATYLARFRRRALVMDGGPSRASWIPKSHNTPGFPHGISGTVLLKRLRAQALEYGAHIECGHVLGLTKEHGEFELSGRFGVRHGRTILLATGVADRLPIIPGLASAIRRGVVRMCPICDGYEAIDRRLAVLGDSEFAQREADFLRSYTEQVTVLLVEDAPVAGAVRIALADLRLEPNAATLISAERAPMRFDHLYLALGCRAQSELAKNCGAAVDHLGKLVVDAHQMTTRDGLYAVGDVVRGLNQIAVGAGEAAVAATAIHNRLRSAP